MSFPVLTLICSVLAYFKYTAKATLTPMLFELAVVNDVRTDMDVISWQLVLLMVVSIAISIMVVIYRFRKITFSHAWIHFLISLLLLFGLTQIRAFANPLNARIPYNIFYVQKYGFYTEKHYFCI